MSVAILFDGNDVEHLDELASRPRRLRDTQLLWADLDRSPNAGKEAAKAFDLDARTATCLESPGDRPVFSDHGRYIHITTYAPREDDEDCELLAVECVVGESWVITSHEQSIPVLDEFAARVSGSGETGALDGPEFLAALLEWVLSAYTAAFDRIERQLEDFDVHAMRGEGADEDIELLVSMRRQVGTLRRALAAHRSALVALTHPELVLLGNNQSGERFKSLYARFEATLQEARDARDAVVGSFDVLIARGGHQTNRIMTVLTLTSVILLPGALLAGIMGMNFKVGFFEQTAVFWVVVAAIVAVAPLTVVIARRQDWI